ncbi:hypothetical protein SDC9_194803 [bioreactor metagenome]|uniref:Uncharacterized protein n=1 Tax=bioreactor metagenome TaxID=1076179 RepID=A0A645I8R3_9ZZZZ
MRRAVLVAQRLHGCTLMDLYGLLSWSLELVTRRCRRATLGGISGSSTGGQILEAQTRK